METKITYGLRDKKTGQLVTLYASRSGCDCCGDTSYALDRDQDNPTFEVNSTEQMQRVFLYNRDHWSSHEYSPGWGPYKDLANEVEVVKITKMVESEPIELGELLSFKVVYIRDIPKKVVRLYLKDSLPDTRHYVFILAELPNGKPIGNLQEFIGQRFYDNNGTTARILFGALPVPEEYVELMKGKPGVLLIASEMVY